MKKKYIEPNVIVCTIKSQLMLAASDPKFDEGTGDGTDEAAKDESMDFDW